MNPASMPMSFSHVASGLDLQVGPESLGSLRRALEKSGLVRAVVVCGRTMAASSPMATLHAALGPRLAGEIAAVEPNSPVASVEAIAHQLAELRADAVIAVGGGSAIVTARAATILLAEARPLDTLCTTRLPDGTFESPRLSAPKLPVYAIPTTPSTAFVKAGSAVHDSITGRRLALFDPKTRARALYVHPDFLPTAPRALVMSASLNTLSTAVEALESPRCDPIADAHLTQAVRIVGRHLDAANLDDISARMQLVVAAVLCGRGTEQSGGGLSSVLAHAIGHRAHAANGIVNAIMLPHTMRFNGSANDRLAEAILEGLVDSGRSSAHSNRAAGPIEALDSFFSHLAVPRRLRDIDVRKGDLEAISVAAMSDWFIRRGPRPIERIQEVRGILDAAW